MVLFALTGGIASGKSTVVSRLRHHGVNIVDCDELARSLQADHSEVTYKILDAFPNAASKPGVIDREVLGEMIFSDASKRKQLDRLMGPYLFSAIMSAITHELRSSNSHVCVDMPLLFETRVFVPLFPVIVTVVADDEVRVRRLVERDSSTRGRDQAAIDAAQMRLRAQLPQKIKAAASDAIINNSGSLEELHEAIDAVVLGLGRKASPWRKLRAGVFLAVFSIAAAFVKLWQRWF